MSETTISKPIISRSKRKINFNITGLDQKLKKIEINKEKEISRIGSKLNLSRRFGDSSSIIERFQGGVGSEKCVANTPKGKLTDEESYLKHSYWFCFVSSLDREQDIDVLKEILFWGYLYHSDDATIYFIVPGYSGYSGNEYYNLRKVFDITDTPALIVADTFANPVEYVKLSKELFDRNYIGEDFKHLRDIMEFFNYLIIVEGKLKKVKKEIIRLKLEKILSKTWNEIKDVISINIG